MTRVFFCLLSLMILASCSRNDIYFDNKTSSIRACDNSQLTKIVIRSKGSVTRFELRWTGRGLAFYIDGQNGDYKVTKSSPALVDFFSFDLNTKYKIVNRTKGRSKIWIETDNTGNVKAASKTSCD